MNRGFKEISTVIVQSNALTYGTKVGGMRMLGMASGRTKEGRRKRISTVTPGLLGSRIYFLTSPDHIILLYKSLYFALWTLWPYNLTLHSVSTKHDQFSKWRHLNKDLYFIIKCAHHSKMCFIKKLLLKLFDDVGLLFY